MCTHVQRYIFRHCGSNILKEKSQGPVVQSVVSLTSSLRVISLTVLADSIHNILIFFSKKIQHICISLYVNFNESFNDVVSFEQLGPGRQVDYKRYLKAIIYNFRG